MAPFYAENGMPDGYRIWGIQPGSSWLRMGIQNEDVVRRVNGETLDNPDKCWKVWLEALRARWIDIEIDRKGHAVLNIVRLRA